MRKLDSFYDFAGLKTFDADGYSLRGAFYDGPDGFQIRQKTTRSYSGYLLTNAALFLSKTSSDDRSSGYRFFAADKTYF